MTMRTLGLLTLIAVPALTSGADLKSIERVIQKEPAYATKTPKYCLLVFGPEAKKHVWLVLDGESLYVDRNGNGDLTEPGKKQTPKKPDATDDETLTFEVGDIADGKLVHHDLRVYLAALFAPHGFVGGLTFSPDSQTLALGGTGAVHLFDVRPQRKPR